MKKYIKLLTLTLIAGVFITITSNANSSKDVGTTNSLIYSSCEKDGAIVNPQFMVFQQQRSLSRLIGNLLRTRMIFLTNGFPTPNPDDIVLELNSDLSKFD